MNNKSVDINQRIPLDILHIALQTYLEGNYDEEYILQQLKLEFKGENRLKKSLRIINKIILRSPLTDFLLANSEAIKMALSKKADRNLILIALLNASFTFAFDSLQILGKFLSVQDLVNSETVKKSISSIYGGNRATENALYSVIPMFIEAGIIARPKTGVYQKMNTFRISTQISKDLYIRSFVQNSAFEELQEYQLGNPYFLFLNV